MYTHMSALLNFVTALSTKLRAQRNPLLNNLITKINHALIAFNNAYCWNLWLGVFLQTSTLLNFVRRCGICERIVKFCDCIVEKQPAHRIYFFQQSAHRFKQRSRNSIMRSAHRFKKYAHEIQQCGEYFTREC